MFIFFNEWHFRPRLTCPTILKLHKIHDYIAAQLGLIEINADAGKGASLIDILINNDV